ncbi:MAG: hypothetical protein LBP42_07165, partial [Treponema sp.]|nr:hypothetical protein [Treponema sp.]
MYLLFAKNEKKFNKRRVSASARRGLYFLSRVKAVDGLCLRQLLRADAFAPGGILEFISAWVYTFSMTTGELDAFFRILLDIEGFSAVD